jgi:Mg-chelatase subunit ChlD
MYSLFSLITFLSHLVLHISASVLVRRAEKCDNLQAASNNGNRKIAIVIDSSGSMESNDPTYLRLTAASNVIDGWLIPQSKASSKKPADLVTVIDFSDAATLDYPLGDPSGANASLSQIGATGGTLISSGVEMAIEQLTSSGSGSTDKRSGILVFTDGEVGCLLPVFRDSQTHSRSYRTLIPKHWLHKSTELEVLVFVFHSAS